MQRLTVAIAILLVTVSFATVGTATIVGPEATAAESSPTEIDRCTTITESGKYVIRQDLHADSGDCIQVTASDVVLDGQGHEVDANYRSNRISVGADDRRLSNVTVRNVEASGVHWGSAIRYEGVDGGTLSNISLSDNSIGVRVVDSNDVSIRESSLHGGGIRGTMAPTRHGVVVANSSDTVIAANSLAPSVYFSALKVAGGATNTTIANNRIRGGYDHGFLVSGGIDINGGIGTTVVNNTIENHSAGIVVQSDAITTGDMNETMVVFENNTITENRVGVEIEVAKRPVTIQDNEITDNERGIYVGQIPNRDERTENVQVQRNDIANNSGYGVLNEPVTTLNATGNYWGAASGPSSANDSDAPFADPVTGTLADGKGDAISENPVEPGVSNVHFDPWLTQPVMSASVGDFENPPTDLDGDGKFEDVNGDGEFDIVDVQALFANRDDPTIQNNPEKFDFNDDGKFDVVDVQALFTELTEEN